jgi:hypothetical protein
MKCWIKTMAWSFEKNHQIYCGNIFHTSEWCFSFSLKNLLGRWLLFFSLSFVKISIWNWCFARSRESIVLVEQWIPLRTWSFKISSYFFSFTFSIFPKQQERDQFLVNCHNCLEREREREREEHIIKTKPSNIFLAKLAINTKSFDHTPLWTLRQNLDFSRTIARSHSIEDGKITVCM